MLITKAAATKITTSTPLPNAKMKVIPLLHVLCPLILPEIPVLTTAPITLPARRIPLAPAVRPVIPKLHVQPVMFPIQPVLTIRHMLPVKKIPVLVIQPANAVRHRGRQPVTPVLPQNIQVVPNATLVPVIMTAAEHGSIVKEAFVLRTVPVAAHTAKVTTFRIPAAAITVPVTATTVTVTVRFPATRLKPILARTFPVVPTLTVPAVPVIVIPVMREMPIPAARRL